MRNYLGMAALAGIAFLVVSTPSQALAPNPGGGGPAGCFDDPASDKDFGDIISSCCYEDGCWICDTSLRNGLNCHWDPSYGIGARVDPGKRPQLVRPPRSRPPKAGPLETSPDVTTQAPSGRGTPSPAKPPSGKFY